MPPPGPYVSVFDVVAAWAQDALSLPMVRLQTNGLPPANFGASLPVLVGTRIGGPRVIPVDNATFVIDTYAGDVATAEKVAETVDTAVMWQLPGFMLPDHSAWVTGTGFITAPHQVPYDNTRIGRMTATYRITVHSVR